jgi:hypothetical protein
MMVQKSARFIAMNSTHVMINYDTLDEIADILLERMNHLKYDVTQWKRHTLHPKNMNPETVDWIFLIDLLNYSFWAEKSNKKRYQVTFDGVVYTGYWSLCACIQRCLANGISIINPHWYANASRQELQKALEPDSCEYDEMPMLENRIDMMQKAGQILVDKFEGSFVNMVKQSNKSAQALIGLVVEHFGELFDDTVLYRDTPVSLHKRVQILVADLWACFEGTEFGEFYDIDTITMFADYRVPQGLCYFNILTYSNELLSLLRDHQEHHQSSNTNCALNTVKMLKRGDPMEVEIRGASIHAVELLVPKIRKKILEDPLNYQIHANDVNAIILDFYLWDIAKEKEDEMKHIPIHYTRSIYY